MQHTGDKTAKRLEPVRFQRKFFEPAAFHFFDALLKTFFDVAQQAKIPLQPNVLTGYGEDGAEIQRYDSGRPSVNMTVPTRYLHGHTGIIQRSDFDGAVALLLQVLTRLDARTVAQLSSFVP